MTKDQLIKLISKETEIHHTQVYSVIESFMTIAKKAMVDEGLFLRTFGTFGVKQRKAKVGRLIAENKSFPIPAHMVPFWKPAKELKAIVKLEKIK